MIDLVNEAESKGMGIWGNWMRQVWVQLGGRVSKLFSRGRKANWGHGDGMRESEQRR